MGGGGESRLNEVLDKGIGWVGGWVGGFTWISFRPSSTSSLVRLSEVKPLTRQE